MQTNRKKRVRTSKWSLPAELTLAIFFIGLLLLIAFAASELDIAASLIKNRPPAEINPEAEIDNRPVSGQLTYESTNNTPYNTNTAEEAPVYTWECQTACTYPNPGRLEPPCTYHLDAFFSRFGDRIGLYYKNLDTGFTYTFNPNTVFFGASLNKAKYALYILIAAERGYIDMHSVHTFTSNDWWGGTGIIRFKPAGARLTTRELLHHSVVYSDNVAHRMLARYMERISFSYRDFVTEIGANPEFIKNRYSHNTSAADTALWFYALHTYLESDSRYGHYLQYDLLNTALYSHPYFTRGRVFGGNCNVNVRLMHSDYPLAQKYGWAVESFNVAGIVYAASPFMLVIVSNMDYGAHELFEEISWLMQEFNIM